MALSWPAKDPDEILDYSLDWGSRLDDGDQIETSTWTVPTGLTKGDTSFTASTTTVWLSGGTAGKRYNALNRVTTTGGRTKDQTVGIYIRNR